MLEKKPEEMPGMLDEPEKKPEKEEPEKKPERKEPENKTEKEKPEEKPDDDAITTTTQPRDRTETPIREGVGSRNPRCAILPQTSLHATARPNRSLWAGSRNSRWTLEGGRWTVVRRV